MDRFIPRVKKHFQDLSIDPLIFISEVYIIYIILYLYVVVYTIIFKNISFRFCSENMGCLFL